MQSVAVLAMLHVLDGKAKQVLLPAVALEASFQGSWYRLVALQAFRRTVEVGVALPWRHLGASMNQVNCSLISRLFVPCRTRRNLYPLRPQQLVR